MIRKCAPSRCHGSKASAALLSTAAVLAACTTPQTYEPAPRRVDVPVAWSVAQPSAPATDLTKWWQRFQDPILSRLIEEALVANPTLEGAAAAIQQARALRDKRIHFY